MAEQYIGQKLEEDLENCLIILWSGCFWKVDYNGSVIDYKRSRGSLRFLDQFFLEPFDGSSFLSHWISSIFSLETSDVSLWLCLATVYPMTVSRPLANLMVSCAIQTARFGQNMLSECFSAMRYQRSQYYKNRPRNSLNVFRRTVRKLFWHTEKMSMIARRKRNTAIKIVFYIRAVREFPTFLRTELSGSLVFFCDTWNMFWAFSTNKFHGFTLMASQEQ